MSEIKQSGYFFNEVFININELQIISLVVVEPGACRVGNCELVAYGYACLSCFCCAQLCCELRTTHSSAISHTVSVGRKLENKTVKQTIVSSDGMLLTWIARCLGDVPDGCSLDDVPNYELLDGLVFGHAPGTVGAAHRLDVAASMLRSPSVPPFARLNNTSSILVDRICSCERPCATQPNFSNDGCQRAAAVRCD